MSPASSSAVSSPPSRFRSIRSGTRINGSAGSCSRLENRLAANAAARRLAAEPPVHRRADIGELSLVDPPRGVLAGDISKQERVLAGMVGRRRRRVATVVRREDQQVAGPHRVEEIGQPTVEILETTMEVERVVAMPPEHVRLDEVDEDQS